MYISIYKKYSRSWNKYKKIKETPSVSVFENE